MVLTLSPGQEPPLATLSTPSFHSRYSNEKNESNRQQHYTELWDSNKTKERRT